MIFKIRISLNPPQKETIPLLLLRNINILFQVSETDYNACLSTYAFMFSNSKMRFDEYYLIYHLFHQYWISLIL